MEIGLIDSLITGVIAGFSLLLGYGKIGNENESPYSLRVLFEKKKAIKYVFWLLLTISLIQIITQFVDI